MKKTVSTAVVFIYVLLFLGLVNTTVFSYPASDTDGDGIPNNTDRTPTLTAEFSYEIDNSTFVVAFTNNSRLNVVASLWNFGDGSTDNSTSPTHTYAVADEFTVSLRVTDTYGKHETTWQKITAGPACMDRREEWETGVNPVRLYLNTDAYDVDVDDNESVTITAGDPHPYIRLPELTDNSTTCFDIVFKADNGTEKNSEEKCITYNALGSQWEVVLASSAYVDPAERDNSTILFDPADLARVKGYRTSNDYYTRGLYHCFMYYLRAYVGGKTNLGFFDHPPYTVSNDEPVKTLDDFLFNGSIVEDTQPDNNTLYISIPDNASILGSGYGGDYIEIISGAEKGRFLAIPVNGAQYDNATKTWIVHYAYGYHKDEFRSIPDSPLSFQAETEIRIYRMRNWVTPAMIAMAALAYRMEEHTYIYEDNETENEKYYELARDLLLYDPMYGGASAYAAHSLASYALAYDMLKERLLQDDTAHGTDYEERIRLKLAKLIDHLTVNSHKTNLWKYKSGNGTGTVNFVGYMFHSTGIFAHALADWVPPAGHIMTHPAGWMDTAIQLVNRALENDWITKDGIENTGNSYRNAALGDVLCLAFIHERVTPENFIKGSRFERAVEAMIKDRFSDGTMPYWGGTRSLYHPLSSMFQNDILFPDHLARMMQWIIEKQGEGDATGRIYGYPVHFRIVPGLFIFSPDTQSLSPAEWGLNDPSDVTRPIWQQPTQFFPHANQAVFRDAWDNATQDRQFFLFGKPEGLGSEWTGWVDLAHIAFFENGEHYITPDPAYYNPSENDSLYKYKTSFISVNNDWDGLDFCIADGNGNGELEHYFSYSGGNEKYAFLQTAQIGWKNNPCWGHLCFWDVDVSRQVLYLKDYVLLFDELKGAEVNDYEISLPTPRLDNETEFDAENRTASWAGVEVWNAFLKRNPNCTTSYGYKTPEQAKGHIHVQGLVPAEWHIGEYTPERDYCSIGDLKLGYVSQVQDDTQNAKFLNLIFTDNSSDMENASIEITKLNNIDNGTGALLEPVSQDYEDIVVVHNADDNQTMLDIDNATLDIDISFQGNLMVLRRDAGSHDVTDYYLKEPVQLDVDAVTLYELPVSDSNGDNATDIHQLALSYRTEKIVGYVEATTAATIELYVDNEVDRVTLTKDADNATYTMPWKRTILLDYVKVNDQIEIDLPAGEGVMQVFFKEYSCTDGIDNDEDGDTDCDDSDCHENDSDNDTVGDDCDNCPDAANVGQADGDADGIGDMCDADTIYGTVTGDVENEVQIDLYKYACGGPSLDSTTNTDSVGYYSFGGLDNGTYKVEPTEDGCSFDPSDSDNITIPQSTPTGYDFESSCTTTTTTI